MALTKNKSILEWIDKQVELVKPDKIVWIDGSEEQTEALPPYLQMLFWPS